MQLWHEVRLLAIICLVTIISGCAASVGVKDPPESDLQGSCGENAGKCAQPAQPNLPQQENRGVVNPRTGEYLPPSGKGVYNPRTGDYYIPSGNGYYNPKTGEFIPKK